MNLDSYALDATQRQQIEAMLSRCKTSPPTLVELWGLMDEAWQTIIGDSDVTEQALARYYAHPVWLLNGIFSETDAESVRCREDMVRELATRLSVTPTILDFGGGFGTLARAVSSALPGARVDILEPFPPAAALDLSTRHPGVRYISSPELHYDAVVCTDVLEHMLDPIRALHDICEYTKPGGTVMFANGFRPYIKCHLASNMHLFYTFRLFAWLHGLSYKRRSSICHAEYYEKTADTKPAAATLSALTFFSKSLRPLSHLAVRILKPTLPYVP